MANFNQVISNFFAAERNLRHFTRGQNVYFENDTLFSYGYHFPMAQFVQNGVGQKALFITSQTYSVTTARHIKATKQAADQMRGLPVFFVDSLRDTRPSHGGEFTTFLARRIEDALAMHRENIDALVLKRDKARSEYRISDYQAQIRFAEAQIHGLVAFRDGGSIGLNPVFPHFNANRVAA